MELESIRIFNRFEVLQTLFHYFAGAKIITTGIILITMHILIFFDAEIFQFVLFIVISKDNNVVIIKMGINFKFKISINQMILLFFLTVA